MPGWSTHVVRFEKERETYRVESIHLESLHQTGGGEGEAER